MDARAVRRLAGIAIAVGLCVIPVLLALWFRASLQGLGELVDCGGSGCHARIAAAVDRAHRYRVWAIATAVVVVAGIVARRAIPAPRSEPAIPEARVVHPGSGS
jgi:hypothetical protein